MTEYQMRELRDIKHRIRKAKSRQRTAMLFGNWEQAASKAEEIRGLEERLNALGGD